MRWYARENKIPYLGICCRNKGLLGVLPMWKCLWIGGANTTEKQQQTDHPVIALITQWEDHLGRLKPETETLWLGRLCVWVHKKSGFALEEHSPEKFTEDIIARRIIVIVMNLTIRIEILPAKRTHWVPIGRYWQLDWNGGTSAIRTPMKFFVWFILSWIPQPKRRASLICRVYTWQPKRIKNHGNYVIFEVVWTKPFFLIAGPVWLNRTTRQ